MRRSAGPPRRAVALDTTPFARAGLPTLRMRPEHARERRFVGDEAAWLGHTDLTTTARYLNADVGQLHGLNDRLVPAAVRATT